VNAPGCAVGLPDPVHPAVAVDYFSESRLRW
jgi:hypothetical protein